MLPQLDVYDFEYAFLTAGTPEAVLGSEDIILAPFDREDVEEIYGLVEGENDAADWMVYGRLRDGRFFHLSAGCDYTGWDCQAWGFALIARTREDIERLGISEVEMARYKGA